MATKKKRRKKHENDRKSRAAGGADDNDSKKKKKKKAKMDAARKPKEIPASFVLLLVPEAYNPNDWLLLLPLSFLLLLLLLLIHSFLFFFSFSLIVDAPIKEGYVFKLPPIGNTVVTWKRRWFKLTLRFGLDASQVHTGAQLFF